MHGRHRVAGVEQVPGAELRRQPREIIGQHGRVLGGELPGQLGLGQVPVGVLHRHARLPCAPQAAQRHDPRPPVIVGRQPGAQRGEQLLPPRQEHRTRRQPQHRARRSATGTPASRQPGVQLVQLGLHSSTQPLDQALLIAELRRADCSGHLLPERGHQRQPLRIGQVGQAHVGDAGAQQRDPRDIRLASAPELQLGDRQALRIVIGGLEPVPVPHDQHIQVAGVHII